MTRVIVRSSNLAAVGYDPKQRLLEVEFRHGGVYQYKHVPPDLHRGLMSAPSIGSYFAAQIKPVFPWVKVA